MENDQRPDTQEQPQPAAPAAPGAAQARPQTIRDYLLEYREYIITAVAVLVAVLAISVWKAHQRKAVEDAAQLLATARSAKNLESILIQYAGTPTAQIALLALAKAQYDGGDYALASATYDRFTKTYPKHPMNAVADVGQIECMEAIGKTPEALAAYAEFAHSHTNHYLNPVALMGQARCLEQLGRMDEAKAIYEDFLTANPQSPWQPDIEQALLHLNRALARRHAP